MNTWLDSWTALQAAKRFATRPGRVADLALVPEHYRYTLADTMEILRQGKKAWRDRQVRH